MRRAISVIVIALLLTSMLLVPSSIQPVKAPVTITVPDDYPTIQAAVNNAIAGDTVYVKAGTYFENVRITKSLSLVGESSTSTTISANGGVAVLIDSCTNVNITGFTLRNGQVGIGGVFSVPGTMVSNVNIVGNIITGNSMYGIEVPGFYGYSANFNITGNNIKNNGACGVEIMDSSNNCVEKNNITGNNFGGIQIQYLGINTVIGNNVENNIGWGISSWRAHSFISENKVVNNTDGGMCLEASYNTAIGNTVMNNPVGIYLYYNDGGDNIIYHNNFANNTLQFESDGYPNTWDNGYPSGGNYWSDYTGTDLYEGPYQNMTGSDGIGDTPYAIDSNNQDNYPLMNPWTPNTHLLNGTIYIRTDGSIDPPTAPIQRNGDTYTLTSNIITHGGIIVEKDGIVLDGANHTLEGSTTPNYMYEGVNLTGRLAVTVKNMIIGTAVDGCIYLYNSSNNVISGNTILGYPSPETNFPLSGEGIFMMGGSSSNTIVDNNITGPFDTGICLNGRFNQIAENYVAGYCIHALILEGDNNTVTANCFVGNDWFNVGGFWNRIFHNNFVENKQVYVQAMPNFWDDGYPSGGNYWGDFSGSDLKSGSSQDQPGTDGIGDMPYVIDPHYATDNYPLMQPWGKLTSTTVNFTESGLPAGATWSVTLNCGWDGIVTRSTCSSTIIFTDSDGEYPFSVTSLGLFASPTSQGTISIDGNTNVAITWLNWGIHVQINEIGLSASANWAVTYGPITQTSTSRSIKFLFPLEDRTYSFAASSPGCTATPSPCDVKISTTTPDTVQTYVIFTSNSKPSHYTLWEPILNSYSTANPSTIWSTGGNCYGFSCTALLYFMRYTMCNNTYPYFPSQSAHQAASTSDLDLGNTWETLNNASLAIMFHQVFDPAASGIGYPSCSDVNEIEEYQYIFGNLTDGRPIILVVGNSTGWHHAVVAWGIGLLDVGTYAIAIYDPNYPGTTQVGIYNPVTNHFSYNATRGPFDKFAVLSAAMITTSWSTLPAPWWYFGTYWSWPWNNWLNFTKAGYNIVIADKNITITSGESVDKFTKMGNSQTFVKSIPNSSGIEEGNVQIYAIPEGTRFDINDPSSNRSAILITWVDNKTGQLVGHGYYLKATTTHELLNYTITPSGSGLSMVTGSSPLNASITFFSSTEQGCSVTQASNITVEAMQTVNLTAPCMMNVVPWLNGNTVDQGCSMPINVTLTNTSNYAETFNVTVYANNDATSNSTVIATFEGIMISPHDCTTLTFVWNTAGFSSGEYIIGAHATPSSSETGTVYDAFAGSAVLTVQTTNGGSAHSVPYVN
jgi:parallel beta-helix repeat protein